jgi:hypothetical protein
MNPGTPTLLRWTEQAEAEAVCALAVLQCEPQSAAVRLVEWATPIPSFVAWPALWSRLLTWFTCLSL